MLSNQTKVSFTAIRLITASLPLISLLPGSTSDDNPKTVHVRQYKRKDGTVVQAHDRAAPGTASHRTTTHEAARTAIRSSGAGSMASAKRDSRGRIERSSSAKRSFEASHPCPGTGGTSGPCKGYVIDHVKPLACGGADAPSNMQWQTAAGGKAKDKVERAGCVVQ
jgi:hypothetical protein